MFRPKIGKFRRFISFRGTLALILLCAFGASLFIPTVAPVRADGPEIPPLQTPPPPPQLPPPPGCSACRNQANKDYNDCVNAAKAAGQLCMISIGDESFCIGDLQAGLISVCYSTQQIQLAVCPCATPTPAPPWTPPLHIPRGDIT